MCVIKIPHWQIIVEFFTYRSARVADWGLKVTLGTEDLNHLRKWIEGNGFKFDNHITWISNNGITYQYSDNTLYVGSTIEIEDW